MIVGTFQHETLALREGEILTVTADAVSSGTVNRLADSAGGPVQSSTAIPASTTVVFGPYGATAFFNVLCGQGQLTYTASPCTPVTQGDTDKVVVLFHNLPTSDPVIAGALWNSAGTVKVSTG